MAEQFIVYWIRNEYQTVALYQIEKAFQAKSAMEGFFRYLVIKKTIKR